jgi:hypothetical protein
MVCTTWVDEDRDAKTDLFIKIADDKQQELVAKILSGERRAYLLEGLLTKEERLEQKLTKCTKVTTRERLEQKLMKCTRAIKTIKGVTKLIK